MKIEFDNEEICGAMTLVGVIICLFLLVTFLRGCDRENSQFRERMEEIDHQKPLSK